MLYSSRDGGDCLKISFRQKFVQTKGAGSLVSGALGHSWGANRAIPYDSNIHENDLECIT